MDRKKLSFLLIFFTFGNRVGTTFASEDSLDTEIADAVDLEFSKDISSIIVESTLKSKCDGNVFVITKECEEYIGYVIMYISDWAPPVLIVSFKDFDEMSSKEKDNWNLFLSWKRRPCSLIFICDLMRNPSMAIDTNDTDTGLIFDPVQSLGHAGIKNKYNAKKNPFKNKVKYF